MWVHQINQVAFGEVVRVVTVPAVVRPRNLSPVIWLRGMGYGIVIRKELSSFSVEREVRVVHHSVVGLKRSIIVQYKAYLIFELNDKDPVEPLSLSLRTGN